MLDTDTKRPIDTDAKRRIDTDAKRRNETARDILAGKVSNPRSQIEQITIALIYKFMDNMDAAEPERYLDQRK